MSNSWGDEPDAQPAEDAKEDCPSELLAVEEDDDSDPIDELHAVPKHLDFKITENKEHPRTYTT